MANQDDIIKELQRRIEAVETVKQVLRNPKVPPKSEDYPAVSIITRDVDVLETSLTGDYLIYKKAWEVWLVLYYVVASGYDDDQAESEVWAFWDTIRKAIYSDGCKLTSISTIQEMSQGTPLIPYVGEPGIALPTEFEIQFFDDTSTL